MREIVYNVLKQLTPTPITDDLLLLGGELDSMGLLTAVIEIEEKLQEQGKVVRLVSDKAMSRTSSPFKTVGTLIEYVEELVK